MMFDESFFFFFDGEHLHGSGLLVLSDALMRLCFDYRTEILSLNLIGSLSKQKTLILFLDFS